MENEFEIVTGLDFWEYQNHSVHRWLKSLWSILFFITFFNVSILQVNIVCTKIKGGEPLYEVIKSIPIRQELVVYYLPETPEELFFVEMRKSLYRQTMDSIIEGDFSIYVFLLNFSECINNKKIKFFILFLISIHFYVPKL